MFPFPIARPQGCDIQTFYNVDATGDRLVGSWNKPVGVSHVYMLLIGAGGSGDGTSGGGSGAVTVWYGAAQHVPNNLYMKMGVGGSTASTVISNDTQFNYSLLIAAAGNGLTAGASSAANKFTASGFFNSVAGQNGSTTNISASTTTFLSGGGNATSDTVTSNYGYALSSATTNLNGTFQMQPIIVGLGGKSTGKGGIGCGGGAATGNGGSGMVLIASW